MFFDIILVAGGLILLFLGGEGLVRGSVALAERLGLSKLIIGLTIVGFGTSMPEMMVSVDAALKDIPEIALGNVIGSNIANILLIIGVAAVIAPIEGWKRTAVREALVAGLVGLALYGMVQGPVVSRVEGVVLLAGLVAYLTSSYWLEKRERAPKLFEGETREFEDLPLMRPWLASLLAAASIGLLVSGADLLVQGSVSLAKAFGVPDAVIGLSLVAVGTSLPELATSVIAAFRRHSDIALGNIIGSNIFNILAIVGTAAALRPLAVSVRFPEIDAPVMLAASFLLTLQLFAARQIGRAWGTAMLIAHGAYLAFLYHNGLAG